MCELFDRFESVFCEILRVSEIVNVNSQVGAQTGRECGLVHACSSGLVSRPSNDCDAAIGLKRTGRVAVDKTRQVASVSRRVASARRKGLTLFELLLVLVVIVLVAAVSVPALQTAFKSQKLKKAADLVRGEWTTARINAMRQGEEFAFFYEPDTGTYWIAPFASVYSSSPPTSQEQGTVGNYDYGKGQLPRDVLFHRGQAVEDTRSADLTAEGGGTANMILFYPDGTTQDAEIFLKNERDHYIRLNLRALTGMPSTSDIMNSNEVNSGE